MFFFFFCRSADLLFQRGADELSDVIVSYQDPRSFDANCEQGELGLSRSSQTRIYRLRNVMRLWQDRSHNNRVSKLQSFKKQLSAHKLAEKLVCVPERNCRYIHTKPGSLCLLHDLCCCEKKSSYYVVFSLTSVSNQCNYSLL